MINRFFILISALLLGLFLYSCRTNKATLIAESQSVDSRLTDRSQSAISLKTDVFRDFSLSIDSVIIRLSSPFSLEDLAGIEISEVNRSLGAVKDSPLFPSISIHGIRSDSGIHLSDSLNVSSESDLAADLSAESREEDSLSSSAVKIFEPPDFKAVVFWSLIIAAAIIIVILIIKRRSRI